MLFFQIVAFFSFIRNEKSEFTHPKKSFNFSIYQNKVITLEDPSQYINDFNNNEKNWYYIHFLVKNLSNIIDYICIEPTDLIIKNTYLLYLSNEQLALISNISLAKKLNPEDKIREDGETIEKAEYFMIFGERNFKLETNSRLFNIILKKDINSYLVKIDSKSQQKKKESLRLLSEKSDVHSIFTYSKPALKNNLMTGFTQKNTKKAQFDEQSGLYYINKHMNEKGLNGEGQIVTVVDTPIDFHHAMFNDDKSEFQVNEPLNHRKFVYYDFSGTVELLEMMISENEHGTHVAGTIAGESACQPDIGNSIFNGNAPKAKLIYYSFGFVSTEDEIKRMNQFGSIISSNSWDNFGFSDSSNFEYTQASEKNPNVLFIFAAGNEYQDGNFTVDDPSGSKNVLCVGAIDDIFTDEHLSRFQKVDDPSIYLDAKELLILNPFMSGTFGTDLNSSEIVIVNAEETNDCEIFRENKIFLAYASSKEKAEWINECAFYYSKGAFVSYEPDKVLSLLEHSQNSKVSVFDITKINESKPIQHADFSSSGPANKGAIKPDVMAPGTRIFSAKSFEGSHEYHGCRENGTCDVTVMDGTSQATPNVAGAAALVSQYFESGMWISSTKETLDSATLRALLINSCVHPQGSKTPDVLYGHGVIDLSTLLPIEGQFGLQITHHYEDQNHPSIGEYGHKVSTINVKDTKTKLQVTLSYLDPALNVHSPLLLDRDLDLVVISPTGKVFIGDNIDTGDSQHLSTNEKVIVNTDEVEIGDYKVHVYSGSFLDSGILNETIQNFSVVATGDIENGHMSFIDAPNCGCDKCDDNKPLLCKCEKDNVGPFCQGQISSQKENKFTVTLKPHEIRRIKIAPKNFIHAVSKIQNVTVEAVNETGLSSFWADKECHLQLGEYEKLVGNFNVNSTMYVDDFKESYLCIALFNNNYEESTFNFEVFRKNKTMYIYIAVGCLIGVIIIAFVVIVVVIAVVKKNRKKNGFTEIKSLM